MPQIVNVAIPPIAVRFCRQYAIWKRIPHAAASTTKEPVPETAEGHAFTSFAFALQSRNEATHDEQYRL